MHRYQVPTVPKENLSWHSNYWGSTVVLQQAVRRSSYDTADMLTSEACTVLTTDGIIRTQTHACLHGTMVWYLFFGLLVSDSASDLHALASHLGIFYKIGGEEPTEFWQVSSNACMSSIHFTQENLVSQVMCLTSPLMFMLVRWLSWPYGDSLSNSSSNRMTHARERKLYSAGPGFESQLWPFHCLVSHPVTAG